MTDSVTRLGKLEFPDNLKAAPGEMAHCLTHAASAHIPGLGNDPTEQAKDIMHKFIFFGETKKLNPLYELQILEVLCNYIENEGDLDRIFAVFGFIFSSLDGLRQDLLHKLISMGVGVQSKKMLDWAARWMQSVDCTSKPSKNLAESVVNDYCILIPGATSLLINLPEVSRSFASCFLTSISHIYFTGIKSGQDPQRPTMPQSLLKITTKWIHNDSSLCLATLQSSKSEPHTAIPGLMQYCVLIPCVQSDQGDKEMHLLHSQLHLGILQTLLQAKGLTSGRGILNKIDIQETVVALTKIQQNLPYSVSSDIYRMVVDRFAQFLQVAMVTGALSCSQGELQILCRPIKPTRLLQMVLGIQTHWEPMEH